MFMNISCLTVRHNKQLEICLILDFLEMKLGERVHILLKEKNPIAMVFWSINALHPHEVARCGYIVRFQKVVMNSIYGDEKI